MGFRECLNPLTRPRSRVCYGRNTGPACEHGRTAEKTKQVTGLEGYWNGVALKNYTRAAELANQAAALAR